MTNTPPASEASATTQTSETAAGSGAANGANSRKLATVGAALGIGSAAIAAALLYVNRPGKKK